jgi:two-component system invasion response regulator UvrY
MIEVLVVDDHEVVRHGLIRIISGATGMRVKAQASNAEEALARFAEERFDVVLLDISLPDRSGLAVLEEIREQNPDQQVLILTMHPEKQYAIRALRLGAAGYLTKDGAMDELLAALRTIAAGRRYITPGVAEQLTREILGDGDRPRHLLLSEREHRVFIEIARGRSLKEIAALLGVSEKTVSTYRARLLDKLGMTNNAEAVRYAVENQLID